MKILLIIHDAFNFDSGAAGSTFKLGQNYQSLGHEVEYYSLDCFVIPKWLPGQLRELFFPEAVAMHIAKLLLQKSVDVIDGSTGDLWFWAFILQRFSKKKPLLVTRVHNLEHQYHLDCLEAVREGKASFSWMYWLYRGSFKLWEVATSLRGVDCVFQLNHQDADYSIKNLGVDPQKTYVFPNGIPDEFLNLPFEDTPMAQDSTICIAQIGTYIARKGIQYSNPALINILQRYSNVRVTFLGTQCHESPDAACVYADFALEFHSRITVIPSYTHASLPTLLQGHHIKLLASTYEAFGKALVEAMACGLAPITTDTGGPLEVVTDGYDAIVVPARDGEAIEKALVRLVTDRIYLDQLRRNAYATAQSYSWRQIAQKRLSAYGAALQARQV